MPLTSQQLANLHLIADASVRCELLTSIPAELTAAQCIIESGWLKYKPGNNCLGIKDYPGSFGRQLLLTREWFTDKELAWFLHLGDGRTASLVDPTIPPRPDGRRQYSVQDWFATFPDLASCLARRIQLFQHGAYKKALASYQSDRNLEALVNGIGKVYATAPNYASVLLSLIRNPSVVDAIEEAREQAGKLRA